MDVMKRILKVLICGLFLIPLLSLLLIGIVLIGPFLPVIYIITGECDEGLVFLPFEACLELIVKINNSF